MGQGGIISLLTEDSTIYTEIFGSSNLTPGSWKSSLYTLGIENVITLCTLDGSQPNNIRTFRMAGIYTTGSNNMIIKDIDIREAQTAVIIEDSQYMIVKNIDTLNTQESSIVLRYGNTTNNLVETNNVVNAGNTAYYVWLGSNNIFRNNTLHGIFNNISGIYTPLSDNAGIGFQQSRGNLIEYNKFYNLNGVGGGYDYYFENDTIVRYNYIEDAGGFYPHGINLTVYGNVVNQTRSLGAAGNSGVTGNSSIKIFHNTFYGLGWYGIWVTGGNSQGSVIFRNNIIHAQRTILLTRFNSEGNVDSDYNCFYTANGTPQFQLFNSTTSKTYYNLSSWQTTGFDNHSVYGDPIFTSGPNLNSSSPCKNMGADVSSMIGFPYKDYYGTTIPQGSAPDIGAVEG